MVFFSIWDRWLTRGRLFLILAGTFCVISGGGSLLSDLILNINGVHASALLLNRSVECELTYLPGGGGKMVAKRTACERAYMLQKRNGRLRIDVSKKTIVRVEYDQGDGISRQLEVDEYVIKADKSRIGDRIDIVYDAAAVDTISYTMSWQTIKRQLLAIAVGLLAFLFLDLKGFARWVTQQLRREQEFDKLGRRRSAV